MRDKQTIGYSSQSEASLQITFLFLVAFKNYTDSEIDEKAYPTRGIYYSLIGGEYLKGISIQMSRRMALDGSQQFYQVMSDEVYTERVYIDPERLLRLKKEKKALKLVPSIFQPPTQPTSNSSDTPKLIVPAPLAATLSSDLMRRTKNSNVQFVIALLGQIRSEQLIELEEGDCLNMRAEERWLIVEGELRVSNQTGNSYLSGQGYFFFINNESKRKVHEVVCVRRTRLLKISAALYEGFLRNYLFLKSAEKIKYLKYCPFFLWSDHLSEDLASAMTLQVLEREQVIYSPGIQADCVYFVKEGVVLLQRVRPLLNPLVKEYEAHYQKNQLSDQEVTLVVKKGMAFGIDGILLKQRQPQENPEVVSKNNGRFYLAKTIGRTQLYVLRRQVLETLFSESDLLEPQGFPREMTKQDLQRICADYADMVVRHRSLPKISQAVTRKDLILDQESTSEELQQKKGNVRRIKLHEEVVKKLSIANIIPDRKKIRQVLAEEQNASILSHFNQKLSLEPALDSQPFTFPSLGSSVKRRRADPQKKEQNMQKYIFRWLKDNDPQKQAAKGRQGSSGRKIAGKQKKGFLINVRSYRSIIPMLG